MSKLFFTTLALAASCTLAKESTNLVELSSKAKFEQALKDHAVVVVDFHATWCGPCRQQGPILHRVAEQYPTVYFIKLNIDEGDNQTISSTYDVRSIPTLIFFKNGAEVKRPAPGVQKEATLKAILDSLLK